VRSKAVSNSGPLIHLAKVGLLHLIRIYDDVVIPKEVKHEVVDVGRAKGYSDAFLVEKAIKDFMPEKLVDMNIKALKEGYEEMKRII